MTYTTHSMMSHAELHHHSALKALGNFDGADGAQWALAMAQRATAEAQAGLLAIELAKYAAGA